MKELFSKEELAATKFCVTKNNMEYIQSCCGKVNVKQNNRSITGFILEDVQGRRKKLLANNEIIYETSLMYNNEAKSYKYPTNRKYDINMYWPIQLLDKINKGR